MTHILLTEAAARVRERSPVLVAGVGSGLSAAGAVAGGADLLAIYNTAVYRQRNLPSILAFIPGEDPNHITTEAAPAVIANAGGRPVLMGFAAHNPQVRLDPLIDQTLALGAAGITNEPFAGLYGPAFNAELERSGCGFGREVMLIEAAARRGLLTLGWACDPTQAERMGAAGADLIGLMLGITRKGNGSVVDEACHRLEQMATAARRAHPDALLVAHGGPLEDPATVGIILSRCPVDGYVTGSSLERGPVLEAVASAMRGFRDVRLGMRS